jgi:trans-2,3-dihydro-3-hydroxyanthranilate isomerase
VLPPQDRAHTASVRIFTPRTEIPFAGHPNIGTAFLLAREDRYAAAAGRGEFVFEEAAGLVPLRLLREQDRIVGAELTAPEALSRRSPVAPATAAACLSLTPQDVSTAIHGPLIASVGLPFLLVELVSRAALGRAKPNLAAYGELLPLDGADAIFAYAQDGQQLHATETSLRARMFSPLDGIVEDAATGSAAAATIALLATLSPDSRTERDWRIQQGVEMGRPSLLLGRTSRRGNDVIATRIGGRCVSVLAGSFFLLGTADPQL